MASFASIRPPARRRKADESDQRDPTTPLNPFLNAAFTDRSGTVWFSSDAGGASKMYPARRRFQFYSGPSGLSFLEDGNHVWLGSLGIGLRKLDLTTGLVDYYLEDVLGTFWTMALERGSQGSIWIGTTNGGLFHLRPGTGEVERFGSDQGIPTNSVLAIIREEPTLWLATGGEGLIKFDEKSRTFNRYASVPDKADTLSSNTLVSLQRDRTDKNILSVGTLDAGLKNRLNTADGKVVRYVPDPDPKKPGISGAFVTDIHQDAKGILWLATWGGGLNRFDREQEFKAFHTTDGLPPRFSTGSWRTTRVISGSPPTTDWPISRPKGKGDRLSRRGRPAEGRVLPGRLPPRRDRSVLRRRSAGFNVFRPEEIEPDPHVPPVVITSFKRAARNNPSRATGSTSHTSIPRSRSISPRCPTPRPSQPLRWRLKGAATRWEETDRTFVSFAGLTPGDYTLEIQGSNAHGVWNDAGIRLAIHVSPPPWRRGGRTRSTA